MPRRENSEPWWASTPRAQARKSGALVGLQHHALRRENPEPWWASNRLARVSFVGQSVSKPKDLLL